MMNSVNTQLSSMLICRLFFYLVLLVSFVSVNLWSILPIGNLWTTWALRAVFIVAVIRYKRFLFSSEYQYKLLNYWLIWVAFCILHGAFVAENYWEWKQLINNGLSLFIPLFLWLFSKPWLTQYIYTRWYKYGLLAFMLFFSWTVGFTQFYLSPLLLLFCFFTLYRKKYAWVILFVGLYYALVHAEEGRAQFIKGVAALLMGVGCYFSYKIPYKLIKIGHLMAYLSTVLLFTIIIPDSSNMMLGNISEDEAVDNNKERNNLNKDTRSLIFYDVYKSAVDNDYWLIGHTPARGNEVSLSYLLYPEQYNEQFFNKNERPRNEMLHLNIFTWTGLVGFILYSILYVRASWLAVYRSNNRYISLLGCFVAFRWSFGWIEDTNDFSISDIALWTMIAMCYSPYFREMNAIQFKNWLRGLL